MSLTSDKRVFAYRHETTVTSDFDISAYIKCLLKKDKKLILFTHHKCASTWLTLIIDDICRRNNLKLLNVPWGRQCPVSEYTIKSALTSGNDVVIALNAEYSSVKNHISANMQCIHIIRNPLSIILSAYYSHRRTHPIDGWNSLADQRKVLSEVDQDIGLALTLAFLESKNFQPETNGPLRDIISWDYADPRIVTLRMEDITSNTADFFAMLSRTEVLKNALMPDPGMFSFAAITGRQQGAIDPTSHYRCGSRDEWRQALPKGVITYVLRHYREFMLNFYPETFCADVQEAERRASAS